jgi:hypothetical protein
VIHLVDASVERFLRSVVPLPQAVAISFATPDKRWGAAIAGPTVNLFLWDVRRDLRHAQLGVQYEQLEGGQNVVRRPDPDIALHYLVTAWAGEPRDEHQLLGSVLRSLLAHTKLPAEHVSPELDVVGGVVVEVAAGEGRPSDFWSSLDGQLKPGFELALRLRVPLDPMLDLGPPIHGVDLAVNRKPVQKAPTTTVVDEAPEVATASGRTVGMQRRRRGQVITTEAVEQPGDRREG